MTKLNDPMRILLASAAQREDGSLLPLPASLKSTARTSKAMASLAALGFAIERETTDASAVHRTDGDLRYGLFVTSSGLAAIGIDDGALGDSTATAGPTPAETQQPSPAARPSKKAAVIDLLSRADGATMPELITVTEWLPHTTRAALTGLRKAGHVIERCKRDDATCYRIVAAQ
ncbi:DUF3489 domain-containing protein [Sphingomonas oligophenolica]|uniref:DUF3489 domain-containing protein n=1 Tax=Sphingomonas oligophenolica TaxID=301154 RepID=A0A502C1Z3_9SPHN|nr:DUF3489 domain-containing protein [Sphingomonas oligophenolica]TPG07505.1 DUF3489 domain-containing protein [Sphingomonas oligophenolica]